MQNNLPKKLRCYSVRQENGWFALCLDLNLAAEADSLEEVRQHLDAIIQDYLDDVIAHPEHLADLVPRHAPLRFWLEYYGIRTRMGLRRFLLSRGEGVSRKMLDDCREDSRDCTFVKNTQSLHAV